MSEICDRKDLVIRDGLFYKLSTDVPFTGEVTGNIQGSFKDGEPVGPYVRYSDNGRLLTKGTYKDGRWDGPWVSYWDNGQLLSEGTWKDGKMDGPWVAYNRDGTVNEELTGTYKYGVKVE